MRIRLSGGGLTGDLERPPSLAGPEEPELDFPAARWWRYCPDGATLTASVRFHTGRYSNGVGVWEVDGGTLRWWHRGYVEVCPLWANETLLVYEHLGGLARRLARYTWPEMSLLDELPYKISYHGLGIEELAISRSQRFALALLNNGQGVNSYAVFGLDGRLRLLTPDEPRRYPPMYSAPVFSPDERLVACAPGDTCWWQPSAEQWPDGLDQDWDTPSLGGMHEYATIVLHDVKRGAATEHRVEMDLPAGWVPEDPQDQRWANGPPALDFPAGDVVRIWLPDGVRVDLSLPLPTVVRLTPPDTCTAPWTGCCSDPVSHAA